MDPEAQKETERRKQLMALMTRHQRQNFCYIYAQVPDRYDAEDLLQETSLRVHVAPLDKSRGEFSVHFLPLKVDLTIAAPQGFNGGHLHHPVSDPPPRGLGLTSDYAANYDERVRSTPAR